MRVVVERIGVAIWARINHPLRWLGDVWSFLIHWLSVEVLLKRRPNGGDIILLRAALIATWVYGLALALETSPWLHPDREWCPSWPALREQLPRTFPWFLTVFAAVYVSLYTRFSSQWLYLANLYNQIRNTEARAAREKGDRYLQEVLSIWKAGFLEDAEVLHLAQKGIFVSVVRAWGANESVRQQFIANTYGGEKRLNTLMADVEDSYERHSSRYKRRRITK